MKKAFLLTESSVYTDRSGLIVARGGGEMSFHILAKGLLKLGIKPLVFAIQEYPEQLRSEVIEGVRYERFPVKSRVSLGLLRYLKAAVAKSRDFDYVFLNQFTPHLILPCLGKQKKIAVVHDVYGALGFWIKQYGLIRGVIGYFIEKIQLKYDLQYADTIFCVSEYGKGRVIDALGSEVEGKIVVSPWPVDVNKFQKLRNKENFALFVGRFVDYKNPEHALYALEKIRSVYPNFKLVMIVGRLDKKVFKRVEKLCGELGFSDRDVEFRFDCGDEEVRTLFGQAKLLLHPSSVEGLGLVCIEAIASGMPVVAYDLPAYKGMLEDGVNAKLMKVGEAERFGDACLEVLASHGRFRDCCELGEEFHDDSFVERLAALCD